MLFSNLNVDHGERVMPQVAHKNQSTGRSRINQLIHYSFSIAEIVLISTIFIGLYVYRLLEEFGYLSLSQFLQDLPRYKEYGVLFIVSMVSYLFWQYHYRLYQSKSYQSMSFADEISKVFRAISYAVLTSIGVAFLLKILIYSRFVVLMFFILSFACAFLVRSIKRLMIVRLARRGVLSRNILIIGAGKVGILLAKEFQSRPGLGCQVIGFIDDHKKGTVVDKKKVIGRTKDIKQLIDLYPVDEIIITIPSERNIVDQIIKEFRKYDIIIRIIPEMFNLVSKSVEVGRLDAIPYVTLVKTPMRGMKLVCKRVFEWLASFFGLVLLSPLFILVAIVIKLDSKGPVFYKQQRVGKGGKYFPMYKFRSMMLDADTQVAGLMGQNEADGPVFKIKSDPRVTRVGKFIRKYSIDELPQLLNVLRGEMTLVGPRPPLPQEVTVYGNDEWRRLEVLPGITGLWQVSGRSDLSFQQWVNLDVYYIENWSFALDLKILLKTIPAVFRGEGAY
jgi:exopolysaccharide biosynthesis polyprenyl glycosylphosphotransferase